MAQRPSRVTRKTHPRIVRYDELIPCKDAFIDTRTPGSDQKENFTIIGPGVSENPNQYVHIAEPHGFNIGGARQPAHCVNSQHSHDTAEVFFVHKGRWAFRLGETGEDAEIVLNPGDLISIPTQVFRGFENIGEDTGFLWAVLGGDNPGRVLWAPHVFDMAKDYGLVLLENGNLVDTGKGETIPKEQSPMPVTTQEQVEALQSFTNEELADCCVLSSEIVKGRSRFGLAVRDLIGPNCKLDWEHGFSLSQLTLLPKSSADQISFPGPEVVFVHVGELSVKMESETWVLGSGDTATMPRGVARQFVNEADEPVEFLRVRGDI